MDVNTSVVYLLDFTRSIYIVAAEVLRTVAENNTLVETTALDLYYLLGFVGNFAEAFRDTVDIIAANSTILRYNVAVWQKLAENSVYIFGDHEGRWGLAYVFRKQYECLQSGWCDAGSITFHALQFLKWLTITLSRVGASLPKVFT